MPLLRRSPLGRRVLIQLVKRSPIDLRRALGIRPELDAATLGHVLSAYSRLGPDLRAGGEVAMTPILDRLEELRSPGYDEPCWGYHFDVETRFFFYPRTTPNTIATAFVGHGLLDAAEVTGDGRLLERATGVGEFFLRRVETTPGPGGACFGYFPGDRSLIHNANLLVAALLARLHARTGRAAFGEAARSGLGFALAHQRDDGSWPYAEGGTGDWVDGFHTGYVLDALRLCADSLPGTEAEEGYRRGLDFYADELLLSDGTPRFTTESTYPVDGQSAAQAIRTLAIAADSDPRRLESAWRVYGYAVARLARGDGAFVFQRRRAWVNRVPHLRWVQAPMLEALGRLLVAESTEDGAG